MWSYSLSLYLFICLIEFNICLAVLEENVIEIKKHHPTFHENDICPDIFNNNQCTYLKIIMKGFDDKFEQKIEQERAKFEKKLEKEKLNFEQEKSLFMAQIKQIKQQVKSLKKQLLNHTGDKKVTTKNDLGVTKTNGQSLLQHKTLTLTNGDPLFLHYKDYKRNRNVKIARVVGNITGVKYDYGNIILILIKLIIKCYTRRMLLTNDI